MSEEQAKIGGTYQAQSLAWSFIHWCGHPSVDMVALHVSDHYARVSWGPTYSSVGICSPSLDGLYA